MSKHSPCFRNRAMSWPMSKFGTSKQDIKNPGE